MVHNFFPALIMTAGAILALHYLTIAKTIGCHVVLADGKTTQTGMSTSLIVALALLGMALDSVYEKFTNIIILERASVSTLPFAIDKSGPETSKGQ